MKGFMNRLSELTIIQASPFSWKTHMFIILNNALVLSLNKFDSER